MAVQRLDVVGSTPVSSIDSKGLQRFVPLSAMQYDGFTLEPKPAWGIPVTSPALTRRSCSR